MLFNAPSLTEMTLEELHEQGRKRGRVVAAHESMQLMVSNAMGMDDVQPRPTTFQGFVDHCIEAEEHSRQFSPAEAWISEINARDDAEEAWEYFEEGVVDGVRSVAWEYTVDGDRLLAQGHTDNA